MIFLINPSSNYFIGLYCLELIKLLLGHSFVSVIAKVVAQPASQIGGISRVLQKLLKYFNGTAISTFAIPPLLVLF